jgi:epoxyqueuosine reductase
MTLADAAATQGLSVSGMAPVLPEDGLPAHIRSVVLLSPDEPGFWPLFTASPEYADGSPHALDRWSRRVIGVMACDLGAKAFFPFGGPPYRPFTRWAIRSGRAHISPVGLLVHDVSGLFLSYRGAIGLTEVCVTTPTPRPCDTCDGQPCRTACPVNAFGTGAYDVPACHAYLDIAAGQDCLASGCKVRRDCPVGAARRKAEQSGYHMQYFHPR